MTRFAAHSTFSTTEASSRGVVLGVSQAQAALPVRADEVHLQQVILNLAMNGNGCHAELRSRLAANDVGNRAGRGSRGGSVGCRFGHRHSEHDKLKENLRNVLYDQAAGHRAWIVDRAHNHRNLRRQDLGGEPSRGRRGVSLHPAVGQDTRRHDDRRAETTDGPVIRRQPFDIRLVQVLLQKSVEDFGEQSFRHSSTICWGGAR